MTKQTRFAVLAAPMLALATAGCVINVDADQVAIRDEKRFTVSAGADVTLDTFDGSIRVESWDKPEILVEITKRGPDREIAEALEVRSTQDGNKIRIEAPSPKVMREFMGIGNYAGPSVSLLVRVPEDVKLTAVTRDGSIVVEHVRGTINLRSGDGSIRAEAIRGEVTARTGDGSVTIVDVEGRLSLESGDGSIRVGGRVDHLHAQTRDGTIVVEADEGSALKEDWDVSTGDGSITFRVPQDFSAEIDADSQDGSVRSNVDGLESVRHDGGRGTLRGRIGAGGHTLKIRSGDGSISLLNR